MTGAGKKGQRRGIYLLPNLFTTASLLAAFYAIVAAMDGRFEPAAMSIFVSMVLDGMDGRIARLTNTQSAFGAEYDSLSDLIAFGLAPSLVIYTWSLQSLGKIGWLAAFIYAACTALRLARFNTQIGSVDKRYFQGLASPAGAALVAGLVWFVEESHPGMGAAMAPVSLLVTVLSAALMVSNIRYHSFKDLDLHGKVPFVSVLVILLVFVFISLDPSLVLFTIFSFYALSGPVLTLVHLHRHRRARHNTEPGTED